MNVFVSYTRRDGTVTTPLLERFHAHLCGVCNPFVHAVVERNLKYQQPAVLWALLKCHLIILIESPEVQVSPWVRLELAIGRILQRPIIRLHVSDLCRSFPASP